MNHAPDRSVIHAANQSVTWLVAVAGLIVSLAAHVLVRHEMAAQQRLEFEWVAHNRTQALKKGIENALDATHLVGQFMATAGDPDQRKFAAFVATIHQRSAGIWALEWAPSVARTTAEAFERKARLDFPDYKLHDGTAEDLSTDRPEVHFPIRFLYTDQPSAALLGFDYASQDAYRRILDQASASGEMVVTPGTKVGDDGRPYPGFLAFQPVYDIAQKRLPATRGPLKGFAVGFFSIGDLANAAISVLEPRGVEFLILDETVAGDEHYLDFYSSRLSPARSQPPDRHTWRDWLAGHPQVLREPIRVGDRVWSITCARTPQFKSAESFGNAHWFVLWAGLALTAALAVIVFQIKRSLLERMRMHRELQQSEHKLRVLFNQSPDIIMTVNRHGHVLLSNKPIGPRDAWTPGKANLHSSALLPSFLHEQFGGALRKTFDTGEPGGIRYSAPDGTLWVLRIVPLRHKGRVNEVMAIATDVTRQQRLEMQAMRNARLASLGVLAATIAHEINNPNNAIHFNGTVLNRIWADAGALLRQQDGEGYALGGMEFDAALEAVPNLLDGIERSSSRIQQIVANLRHMTRRGRESLDQDVDLKDLFQTVLDVLQYQITKYTDHYEVDLPAGLPPVRGNPLMIEQVFINLVINALQSLESRSAAVRVRAAADAAAGTVRIIVEDEGAGIAAENMPHVLEPFFTTKDPVDGMGLGLAISSDIVRSHGGELDIQSRPGCGTVITVTLPTGPAKEENADG